MLLRKEEDMESYLVELALNEPKRCVDEAIAFYKATGRKIALAEFSNPQGPFAKGEQYTYVLGTTGMMLAHPVNEKFVGKDFYRVQDPQGKHFIKNIVDTANNGGFGWVEYTWFDPATKTERPKTVYFEKFDDLIFCSGVYKRDPAPGILELPLEEPPFDEALAESVSELSTPPIDMHTKEQMEEEENELALDDAKRWVGKAVAFCRANRKEIALAEFSNLQGRFMRDDLYIYALDINGLMLAHPVNERYVGKDFYHIQDSDGKRFIKEIVDTANNVGSGWVEYKWFNPATKKEQLKRVYFEKFNNVIFCSGIYMN
jgi:cytochrome c